MRKQSVRRQMLAVLASLALFAAACGGDDDAGEDAPQDATSAPEEADSVAMPTESAATGPSSTNAASTQPPGQLEGVFRIVGTLPLTGPLGPVGSAIKVGIDARVHQLNGADGILGRQIEVEIVDSGSDPQQAVSAMRSLLADPDDVGAVIAEANASINAAVLPVVEETGLLSLTTAAGGTDAGDPTIHPDNFTVGTPVSLTAEAAFDALERLGLTKIGFVGQGDESSRSVLAFFEQAVPERGLELVGAEQLDPSGRDYTAQLQTLRDAGAEVLMGLTNGTTIGVLTQGVADLAWDDVKLIGDLGWAASPLYDLVPESVHEQVVLVGVAAGTRIDGSYSALQTALLDAIEATGGDLQSLTSSSAGVDAITAIKYAFEKAGAVDSAAAITALEGIAEDPAASDLDWVFYPGQGPRFTSERHDAVGVDPTLLYTLMEIGPPEFGTYAGTMLYGG